MIESGSNSAKHFVVPRHCKIRGESAFLYTFGPRLQCNGEALGQKKEKKVYGTSSYLTTEFLARPRVVCVRSG